VKPKYCFSNGRSWNSVFILANAREGVTGTGGMPARSGL
jgi:hypothetical protein